MKTVVSSTGSHALSWDRFSRASRYDPEWVFAGNMGPNVLWLAEWLSQAMHLERGMRVLDMGCGKAVSSIFLVSEFGVEVWANDLWISASENMQRIRDAGLEGAVHPIHAEAHELPYAEGFFDAALSLDSYQYYGTDDLYLGYFHKFMKPGAQLGIVVPGLHRNFPGGTVPDYLLLPQKSGGTFWAWDCWCFHTAAYWRHLWSRYPFSEVQCAEAWEDGGGVWLRWERALAAWTGPKMFPSDVECLQADNERYLTFVRAVMKRTV
jgi:SAM-dependent methyltransferase